MHQIKQYDLFEYLHKHNLSKKIRLKYNTNLTNIPDTMLEHWKKFKTIKQPFNLNHIILKHITI